MFKISFIIILTLITEIICISFEADGLKDALTMDFASVSFKELGENSTCLKYIQYFYEAYSDDETWAKQGENNC